MLFGHVNPQTVLGGEAVSTDGAHGLAAVPGEVFAASGAIGQELATAGHRAEGGHAGRTCRTRTNLGSTAAQPWWYENRAGF